MNQADMVSDSLYFHAHGLKTVAPERLNAALAEVIEEFEVALYGTSRTELTDAETAVLEGASVDVDEKQGAPDPMLAYVTAFAAMRATSLTPATLARKLGITPVRVRQMIREQTLYAMRIGGRLHVPVFQLAEDQLVPNIAPVNQAIADLDPVSVLRWFTTRDPDLQDMTPLNWLKAGRHVDAVLKVVPELY